MVGFYFFLENFKNHSLHLTFSSKQLLLNRKLYSSKCFKQSAAYRIHGDKWMNYSFFLSHKLRCYTGISGPRKSCRSPSVPLGQVDEWKAKPSRFSIQGSLSELSRIVAAKTLKYPYRWQTVRFKLSYKEKQPIYTFPRCIVSPPPPPPGKWNHEGNVARSVKFIQLWSKRSKGKLHLQSAVWT